jgi:DNA ligase-1
MFDGVRAYWNGETMYSKRGKEIPVPSSFVHRLPKIKLDGELWMERGSLEKLVGVINSPNASWVNVKYLLSDLPDSVEPFEERMKHLKSISLPAHVRVVDAVRCQGPSHLLEHLDYILEHGGEGILARESNFPYVAGITTTVQIVKVEFSSIVLYY